MKCVKILTRIKSPYELLKQETPAGAFVYKKYEKVNAEYQKVLKRALKEKSIREIFMLKYSHIDTSFTKDLANELLHRKPKKIIIIAREKGDEMKVSIRAKNLILPPIVAKALAGINGYGGGHEHACGANIKKEDFDKFIRNFEEYVSKSKSL